MDYFDEINSIEWAFIQKIEEPRDNFLVIIIIEGKVADYKIDTIVGKRHPVIIEEQAAQYQIKFDHTIVAYHVMTESFVMPNEHDKYSGKVLRRYSESSYLDYVHKETFAESIFPGELRHYGIVCQNHVIDVISLGEPVITRF